MLIPEIKKIDFRYNNLVHSALVSICGTSEEMFVHAQLINSFLRKVFGIEHIRFSNKNGQIQLQEARNPLMSQIAGLISTQLRPELMDGNSPSLRMV